MPRCLRLMRLKVVLAASCPPQSKLHGLSRARLIRRMLRAFIKGHDDVPAQGDLNLDGTLGSEYVRRAVKMRSERYPFLTDLPQFAQAEHLKPARIGENRPLPGAEFVQSPQSAHQFMPRTQVKMVRVAQDDLRAQLFQNILGDALDRALRAHGHEHRSLHLSMGSGNSPGKACAGLRFNSETKHQHKQIKLERYYKCHRPATLPCPPCCVLSVQNVCGLT